MVFVDFTILFGLFRDFRLIINAMASRQCGSKRRKCENKYVSVSALSREEKTVLDDLSIKLKVASVHGNSRSTCWNHIGHLHSASESKVIDESRYYCLPCLESQKAAGAKGHLSKVCSFSASTSTGTISMHLSMKHDIHQNYGKVAKIVGYLKKYDASSSGAASSTLSSHEFNRDIALWFCKDLIPFEGVAKNGMIDFFRKILPQVDLPTPATLSGAALDDVYLAVHAHVTELLKDTKSMCLMFDGWTDRYRARPYLGIRATFIRGWSYCLVTLGCHVLPVHTGREIADHVVKVVKQFVPELKKVMLSTCHDGAANMVKSSQFMKVDHFQHCTAHALHLLLTVDSLNSVGEIVALLQKCRDIVTSLHFKTEQLEDEMAAVEDKRVIDVLKAKMSEVSEVVDLDDQYPVSGSESNTDDDHDTTQEAGHRHVTLKGSCPTRWNSSLIMSIIDMKREVMNMLKRIGKVELCLDSEELEILEQLKTFLKPFEMFTDLVSSTVPSLSLIPLFKLQIKKLCAFSDDDSIPIRSVKERILAKVESRLPDSQALLVHQLLDPTTKDAVPSSDAITLLQDVVRNLSKKGLIAVQMSTAGMAEHCDSPCSKRRLLKAEMLNELRRQSPSTTSDANDVTLEITNYLSCR